MTPALWKEIERLYQASKELQSEERAQFLARACRDEETRREVESLLAHRDAPSFLERPGFDLVAEMVTGKDSRTLLGLTIDQYQVLSLIGVGGMGVVYRARDTKLVRDVALKALPEAFSLDPERVTRFEREARVLASLNHPNIAAIYDLKELEGIRCLVLELVEGPTLADRIAQGPIPMDEALPIACQIAEALEAAHERGVVHRDLKPANVKLTRDGQIKVLDFGLAKAVSCLSNSSTLSVAGTEAGAIMGTPSHMSPEQAKGKTVDWRSDIWAFGVVLYEMLTGRMPFTGERPSETMAFVMTKDPDWNALPPNLPTTIRELLRRCLIKDLRNRLQASGDARILIEEAIAHPTEPISNSDENARKFEVSLRSRRIAPWTLAGTLALALALLLWAQWRTAPVPPSSVRLTAGLGAEVAMAVSGGANAVLSPDGRLLAFNASDNDRQVIYVRQLDQLKATPLPGTEGARSLFFSPDGRWIAFFTGGKLKKVPTTGGAAVTLCDAPDDRGGSWSDDGNIVFAPTSLSPLFRVSSAGGTPEPLTTLDQHAAEVSHRWPQLLPGGHAVLFTVTSVSNIRDFDNASVAGVSLATGEKKILRRGGYFGRYLPSGHLVYVRQGTLFAAPFDSHRMEVTGPSAPAIEGVSTSTIQGSAQFAFSNNGTALFLASSEVGRASIYWMDRQGKTVPLRNVPAKYSHLRFSPDGRHLAVQIEGDLWIYEWGRETMSRLFTPGSASFPAWTPDGRRIAFAVTGNKPQGIYWQRTDGTGDVQRLMESTQGFPHSWHPSGKFLVLNQIREQTGQDLMILPVDGDETSGWKPGKPTVFVDSPGTDTMPAFSPDGRWIAYQSNESGRIEVYVRPFPGPGGKWQISTSGAGLPVWSRNSKELFYETDNRKIMVSTYTVEGDSFRVVGQPRLVSDVQLTLRGVNYNFDLHPDGNRFAVLKAPESSARSDQVDFIFNFFDELRRIAPAAR